MNPSFEVPPQYFYALAARLPADVSADVRFRIATLADEKQVILELHAAIDSGVITADPQVTPEQVARRLRALGAAQGATPVCASGVGFALSQAYVNYRNATPASDPEKDIAPFWAQVPANAALAGAHLEIIFAAITQEGDPRSLINAVRAHGIALASVPDLANVRYDQWEVFFTANPARLPAFTAPGTLQERIGAFVRRLRKFFEVASRPASRTVPAADAWPRLDVPLFDPIETFLAAYLGQPGGAGFTWGSALDEGALAAAIGSVFPADRDACRWLDEAIRGLNGTYGLADVVASKELGFSIAESLYARGVTDASQIRELSEDELRAALTGTVAYDYVAAIYAKAGGSGGPSPAPAREFRPINTGRLTNCVPQPHRSPLGTPAYLSALLRLRLSATCDALDPDDEEPRLSDVLAARRGPLEDLLVTATNTDIPIPRIDLVNECLEALASGASGGAVHQTNGEPPHDTEVLRVAVPEHVSPAAYAKLASDASASELPYSQPLDVNRTYTGAFGSTRYEVMRRFRRDITEFVLDPQNEPDEFRRHQWRYPVRIETAREYLTISKEEHELLFTRAPSGSFLAQLYGFEEAIDEEVVTRIAQLLARLGLTYCELVDVWHSGYVPFERETPEGRPAPLSECPPCYLERDRIRFEEPLPQALGKLAIFVRLWRKLGGRYSFAELRDICEVLGLYQGSTLNPDFIRQLVALQMLRDVFGLRLRDGTDTVAGTGHDRTHLLALWGGPSARKWPWAVGHLLERLNDDGERRPPEFLKLLTENLERLGHLAGFERWHEKPTHTLRFAEVLRKICRSHFGIGELLYVLTADAQLAGDDPFPLAEEGEAREDPLHHPDDDDRFSLWQLREKLLAVEPTDEEVQRWTFARMSAALRADFGFDPPAGGPDPLVTLGEHFFPEVLEREGTTVDNKRRTYRVPLVKTAPAMWNTSPEGPLLYDVGTSELYVTLPVRDEAVLAKLGRVKPLSGEEQHAVKDLYFKPRVDLARFSFLFPNLIEAEAALIEEGDEDKRWLYFQRSFARCRARARVLAAHLAAHVDAVIDEDGDPQDTELLARRILVHLLGDENRAKAPPRWEADDGERPAVTWGPLPVGGALAALLGLVGNGLRGEYRLDDGKTLVWREMRGPADAFGSTRNEWNAPAPCVVPALGFALTNEQLRYAGIRNGVAMSNATGKRLGCAQPFCVTWTGILLIERDGSYRFWGGGPTANGEEPDLDGIANRRWRVTLRRGQRSWVVLSHAWPGEDAPCGCSAVLPLKRGAYDLTIELVQCPPSDDDLEEARPQRTGFQLKYEGPDTNDTLSVIPHHRLYVAKKNGRLADELPEEIGRVARTYLEVLYPGSLRDIRRTYQRAFKALLFARRFSLSARDVADFGQSELGFRLDHPRFFAGLSFYRQGSKWNPHRVGFDFNHLPLQDPYHGPLRVEDERTAPSAQREHALFDLWERTFEYTKLRLRTRHAPEDPAWLLFNEAAENHPDDPAHLLRHLGVNLAHAPLVLRYWKDHKLTSDDLIDERWATRAWHADRWLARAKEQFFFADVREARPDLWASDGPENDNLVRVVRAGFIENGDPRRYQDLQRLNDGLRLRGRSALIAYLTRLGRVALPWGGSATRAKDLSDFLLIDVEAGLCERASRIEDAISAIQTLVQRARLGLEPGVGPSAGFADLWDRSFASFQAWASCTRRGLYREDWIELEELQRARRSEAFRFLEDRLRGMTLTLPTPGGLEHWNSTPTPPRAGLMWLQARDRSHLRRMDGPREGLNLMGTPEQAAARSWLAPFPSSEPRDDEPVDPALMARPRPASSLTPARQPMWLEAAIRLGTKFLRVAAAGVPPASAPFDAHSPRSGCCRVCGRDHEAIVDEYYFWLEESEARDEVEQIADWPGWEDATTLPKLLHWPAKKAVRLMWSRIHDGEVEQPRRSVEAVLLVDDQAPELELVGRTSDSLVLRVRGAVPRAGHSPPPEPGFRYDLATDDAVAVPGAVAEPVAPQAPGGLSAYPYFIYFTRGASVLPRSRYAEGMTVGATLRAHCRFEAALKWYALDFDPIHGDNRWCPADDEDPRDMPGPCCQHTGISDAKARSRSVTLAQVETLLEWGDARMRANTPEAFEQARVLFDTASRLLGAIPQTVRPSEPAVQTIGNFAPDGPPLNPRLMAAYEHVDERLSAIHACLNARRLRNGQPRRDMPYFGSQTGHDPCDEATCCAPSPYRFLFLVARAAELAGEVRTLGGALLAAFEKGDAEYLASVRAGHEHQVLSLAQSIRENQWREADWQLQALKKTREIAQTRRRYYAALLTAGLSPGELDYQALTNAATTAYTNAAVMEAVAQTLGIIPDVFVGMVNFTQIPVGTKLAQVFSAIARISMDTGQVLNLTAGLRLTQAGWLRREEEWRHQVEVLDLEIEQIDRQIRASERRRAAALRELEVQMRQIANAREVQDVLRDKLTGHQLYLWMQRETAALYYQMYELALCVARQAERAFNYERGHTARRFIPNDAWEDLRKGLLAGERLQLAVRTMEKAFLDANVREYELTKHISLRLSFPEAFLALKLTGSCVIDLPEWLFDLDYPGQYMRRIKSVGVSLPCVVGPYAGVHSKLTLLSSSTRVDPRLRGPLAPCCPQPAVPAPTRVCSCWPEPRPGPPRTRVEATTNGYIAVPDDPRIVKTHGATEAIATSTGQTDAGLFELQFRDERYLPFELAGAVSRWRLELRAETNRFDLDTLSDVVLHLNYTAREGGDVLARAASEVAQSHLPDDGFRLFDIRRELPEIWQRLSSQRDQQRTLDLSLARDMFAFLPGNRDLYITRLELFVESDGVSAHPHREVQLVIRHAKGCHQEEIEELDFEIVASDTSSGAYHGAVDVRLGPLRGNDTRQLGTIVFEQPLGDVNGVFLLVRYEAR